MIEKRQIGSLEVSVVAVGCNTFGWPVLPNTLDAGINFFDETESYGDSERLLGLALKGRRADALIATKFSHAHPEEARASLDASLARLGTNHIDLWQLHKPDPAVPLEDTLGVAADAIRDGKVCEGGCSNFSVDLLSRAGAAAAANSYPAYASAQSELSILQQGAADVLAWCEAHGTAFLPYFPLAAGLLTGKYRKGQMAGLDTRLTSGPLTSRLTEGEIDHVEGLALLAESKGRTLLELAFGWLLASPAVASVVAGVRSTEQITANVAAAAWRLSQEEVAVVNRIVATA